MPNFKNWVLMKEILEYRAVNIATTLYYSFSNSYLHIKHKLTTKENETSIC